MWGQAGGQEDQLRLLARPAAGRWGVCRRKGGGFYLIRVRVLRPWLEGKLAGCQGGEPLALGLLEGGMGLFVLHPRPWQPTQGCVPQQRQGQLPDSGGVCLEVGLCHGWCCGSENIGGGRGKTPPLTTLFTGSQGFFFNSLSSNSWERY